jgi:hypothetical protein
MKPMIMLVNLSAIRASNNGKSLFLDGEHILDSNSDDRHPLFEISSKMASALNTTVTEVNLTLTELAICSAARQGLSEDAMVHGLSNFTKSYCNEDVLNAALAKSCSHLH